MTSRPAINNSPRRGKRVGSRARGVIRHTRGLGKDDHVCWRYDDPAEFRLRAGEFLADGLAAGQRVLYVGAAEPQALTGELSAVEGVREAVAAGAACVASVRGTYLGGTVVDPDEQVASYRELTEQALVDGFSGLRVAADATALVATAEQVNTFARYEHRIDRYMARQPFAAMCAYDAGQRGADTVAQIACMHPATNPSAAPFRLHATDRPGCVAAVAGELDLATAELWPRAWLAPARGRSTASSSSTPPS
jgi:MEDS: MEthanogen/methylotroph, DcmR Sensory domain